MPGSFILDSSARLPFLNHENLRPGILNFLAEGVGFEPTSPFGETVFKTAAIDHSAIPPRIRFQRITISFPSLTCSY